jgi:hypothetical protein
MIANDSVAHTLRRRALHAALAHVAAVARHWRRRREARARRPSPWPIPAAAAPSSPAAAAAEPAAPDPVRVAVLAIEGVARASMRACFTGNSIDVAAPDEATAGVLRRALAESGRATDRLVRIVVAG